MDKSNKMTKTNSSNGTNKHSDYGERVNEKVLRYEVKIKKMDDVIKIASDSKEKYVKYQIVLLIH